MKRIPLKRKTPLTAKASLKRTGPIKVKRKPPKPKAEAEHLARVAAMPCLVCGKWPPSTVHHVTSNGSQRIARSDRLVVPLCPAHHQIQHGPRESVEALGHAGFTARYGIDLLGKARELWGDATHS